MSLSIESTHVELNTLIDKIQEINKDKGEVVSVVTVPEYQEIRDGADREISKVTELSVQNSLAQLQKLADELVEVMQQLALEARRSKLSASGSKLSFAAQSAETTAANAAKKQQVDALKNAVEFQLAYAVLGYKSSIERL
jgi:hypothetical protein